MISRRSPISTTRVEEPAVGVSEQTVPFGRAVSDGDREARHSGTVDFDRHATTCANRRLDGT